MMYLLAYTRKPIDNIYYDPRLAFSVHLALSEDGKHFNALNHNSGVLFAKGDENPDGSIEPKALDKPVLFKDAEGYGVAAVRTDGEGNDDPAGPGSCYIFRTEDFLTYTECGPADETRLEAIKAQAVKAAGVDVSGIEGCIPQTVIGISDDIAERLVEKLMTPCNIAVELPEEIKVSSAEELRKVKALLTYSDGTSEERRVDWKTEEVDFTKPGTVTVSGCVHRDHFDFPIAYDRADPCVGKWNGKYYFVATNDADGNHSLYIRESDTVPGLVNAEEHLILDSSTYPEIGGLLWAPEFHIINGKLYIFHAATPEPFFCEESHVMALKPGGDPCKKEDWEKPRRVVKVDGTNICEMGKEITLDMTTFNLDGREYAIWSQRQFLPKDLGAWLYIARLNMDTPWVLDSEPVVLSKPDYGWGNNHTFVEEGPFALYGKNELFITFSAAAVDTSYVVGLLTLKNGCDPLDPKQWIKKGYPILTSRSVDGEFGTGHNAFVTDDDGLVWNTYHARPGTKAPRSSGFRRVKFDSDGEPRLDVTEDLDVDPKLAEFTVRVTVTE